mmetsp:Transcript_9296/g.16430  ORF Transcript_9296/g.16430 Transcript_9296/m.16430 type:complete len:138 (-) Transcript_9296:694-1107(-)
MDPMAKVSLLPFTPRLSLLICSACVAAWQLSTPRTFPTIASPHLVHTSAAAALLLQASEVCFVHASHSQTLPHPVDIHQVPASLIPVAQPHQHHGAAPVSHSHKHHTAPAEMPGAATRVGQRVAPVVIGQALQFPAL